MLALDISVDKLRDMVRISTNAIDDELITLSEAFLLDLSRAGVEAIPDEDTALVEACLRMYLRWQENYNGEADRYMQCYESLRNGLALAGEYQKGGEPNGT